MKLLSYASGASEKPLIGKTIGQFFDEIAARYPDNEALVSCHQSIRWTYRQLQAEVGRCARAFIAAGIDKGARVGIWSPNRAEWTVVQLATAKIGAILVNINPSYRLHELEYALNQSGCKWLIAAPEFKGSDYVAMVAEIADRVPSLEKAVFFWTDEWNHLYEGDEYVSDDELNTRRDSLRPDDPINIQYTSGTTGFPKGAMLSHRNLLMNAFYVGECQGFSKADRLCIPVPLYHCF
ncbi:MAG: AMP-binding protein, partial [Phaeodactylibacter sp.]|nr:AMP-binding protein [Phaeodactylibacter sp.]